MAFRAGSQVSAKRADDFLSEIRKTGSEGKKKRGISNLFQAVSSNGCFFGERAAVKKNGLIPIHFRRYIGIILLISGLLFELGGENGNSDSLVILASGDTMLGSWAEITIPDSGFAYPFQYLTAYTTTADIFFTNLEAPFGSGGTPFDKKYTFRVKPEMIRVLLAGKINLVSLANNHTMDFGPSCLQQTRELLDEHGIRHAGAGRNRKEARQPAIMEVKGKKIGFLSYSLTFPEEFWATDTSAGTCFPYESFVFKDVARLDSTVDFVIVSCHWGQELMQTPKPYQVNLARRLIDHGADLILGHHPHVLQGIEFYKDRLIAYSLGNFIFGSYSESAKESILLRITLQSADISTVQAIPINVYNKEVDFRPAPLQGEAKEAFLHCWIRLSSELNSTPIGINSDGFMSSSKTDKMAETLNLYQ